MSFSKHAAVSPWTTSLVLWKCVGKRNASFVVVALPASLHKGAHSNEQAGSQKPQRQTKRFFANTHLNKVSQLDGTVSARLASPLTRHVFDTLNLGTLDPSCKCSSKIVFCAGMALQAI